MSIPRIYRLRRAFTLFELLVALLLIGAILVSLFTFVSGILRRSRLMEATTAQMSAADAVIDELESALVTTYVAGSDGKAGISGTTSKIHIQSRTVMPGAWGDAGGVEVSFVPDSSGTDTSTSAGQTGELRGHRLGSPGSDEVLGTGLERVRFRYYTGSEWKTEFDSASADTLPVAIEVAFWYHQPESDQAANPAILQSPDEVRESSESGSELLRNPDRVRVLTVPDAPVAGGAG